MLRAFATMSRPTRAITILRPQWLNLSVASCPSPFPVASAVRDAANGIELSIQFDDQMSTTTAEAFTAGPFVSGRQSESVRQFQGSREKPGFNC